MRTQATRFGILGRDEDFPPDTLLARNLRESDTGRYFCASTGKFGTEVVAECYDVLVLPRSVTEPRFAFVGKVDVNESGNMVEEFAMKEANQSLVFDCTVSNNSTYNTKMSFCVKKNLWMHYFRWFFTGILR